jgi:hypothetical protein
MYDLRHSNVLCVFVRDVHFLSLSTISRIRLYNFYDGADCLFFAVLYHTEFISNLMFHVLFVY